MRAVAGRRECGGGADAAVRARAQHRRMFASAGGAAEASRIMNMTYVTPGVLRHAADSGPARPRVHGVRRARARAPVIVVNQAFVAPPFARSRIRSAVRSTSGGVARTIVGIVGDIQQKAGWGNFGPVARGAGRLHAGGAGPANAFVTMVHTWFSPSWFVRLAGPQDGIVGEMQQAVAGGRSAAAVREVPDAGRGARRSGRDAARAGDCCSGRSPASRCCSRRSASTGWSRTRSPSGRASSASAWRSARRPGRRCSPPPCLVSCSPSTGVAIGLSPRGWPRDDGAPGVGRVRRGSADVRDGGGRRAASWPAIATLVPALRIVRLNPIKALRQA